MSPNLSSTTAATTSPEAPFASQNPQGFRNHQLHYVTPEQQQLHHQQHSSNARTSNHYSHKQVHQLKANNKTTTNRRDQKQNQGNGQKASTSKRSTSYQPPTLDSSVTGKMDSAAPNRPLTVQSDAETIMYHNDEADVFHYTVDLENYQQQQGESSPNRRHSLDDASLPSSSETAKGQNKSGAGPTINSPTASKNIKQTNNNTRKSPFKGSHLRPSSADSIDRFVKPSRKNITLPQKENDPLLDPSTGSLNNSQNLRRRSPKYYRNLLQMDHSSDVSYLLDAELKTLTVNQIMKQRKQGKKLPPLNNSAHPSSTMVDELHSVEALQERIKFPSILDEVLKMIGKPTETDLPQTKIPKQFHRNEESPIVTDQKKQSTFDPQTGVWSTHVFPSKIPASRVEVVHLSKAFEQMIEAVKATTKVNSIDELTAMMDVLEAVGTELVRQVHVHCAERGVLLRILLNVFQSTNKQAVYFYQKARQMVFHKHNEMKTLSSKVSDLSNLVAQKNNEVSLFRNEVHELKMKLREQRDQNKKLMKERDMHLAELQKLQEEQFKRLRAHAPKNAISQTTMTMQRIDLLEAKAIEALNEEHRRIEAKKRQEEEERAAAEALREAQEELKRAEEERRLLEEMRRKEEEEHSDEEYYKDRDMDNDKRVQTDDIPTTGVEIQTDPVKFKGKRAKKEKKSSNRSLKYRNSPSDPKTPPRVVQPSMQPIIQPIKAEPEFEVRKNELNRFSSDDEDESHDQRLSIPLNKKSGGKSPPRRSARGNSHTVAKSPKVRNTRKGKTDKLKTSEVRLRTLSQDDLFELFHDLVVNKHGSRKYSLRWVNKNVLELLSELTDSDFLASTTDMRNIRRFVYDYHLVKFGLATIAVQHLAEFLHNVKMYYRESSRVRTFIQFCVLAQWYGKEQQDIYTLSTLSLYLKALNFTKSILNKKAQKELEEGTLYVSETFVFNLVDRLKLPLTDKEQQYFFETVSKQSEDGYIYFDDLAILLIATYHKHEEGQTIDTPLESPTDANALPSSGEASSRSTTSVSVAAFKRVVRNFFGKLYIVGNDVNDPKFVQRNGNISKRDLVQVYTQCQRLVVEIINSLENPDVRNKFLETHANLYRIVTEVELEEALQHYRNYICILLRERKDENSAVFSRMISRLFARAQVLQS